MGEYMGSQLLAGHRMRLTLVIFFITFSLTHGQWTKSKQKPGVMVSPKKLDEAINAMNELNDKFEKIVQSISPESNGGDVVVAAGDAAADGADADAAGNADGAAADAPADADAAANADAATDADAAADADAAPADGTADAATDAKADAKKV